MRPWSGLLLAVLALGGCAELRTSPEEQHARLVHAVREWIRGPMMESCDSLPGPDSRAGCVMALERVLAELRGDSVTHDDQYRVELAKAKGSDETRRLWGRKEREAWLRGPRAAACEQAPTPTERRACLDGLEEDLDRLSRPDDMAVDPPEVRAARAVARIEARDRDRAIDQQRAHEMALARKQAAGQALLGLGMSGGLFRNTTPPAPLSQPQPIPALPLAPLTTPRPPVNCITNQIGQYAYTNCQ